MVPVSLPVNPGGVDLVIYACDVAVLLHDDYFEQTLKRQ